jgi:hypothetical protein
MQGLRLCYDRQPCQREPLLPVHAVRDPVLDAYTLYRSIKSNSSLATATPHKPTGDTSFVLHRTKRNTTRAVIDGVSRQAGCVHEWWQCSEVLNLSPGWNA